MFRCGKNPGPPLGIFAYINLLIHGRTVPSASLPLTRASFGCILGLLAERATCRSMETGYLPVAALASMGRFRRARVRGSGPALSLSLAPALRSIQRRHWKAEFSGPHACNGNLTEGPASCSLPPRAFFIGDFFIRAWIVCNLRDSFFSWSNAR